MVNEMMVGDTVKVLDVGEVYPNFTEMEEFRGLHSFKRYSEMLEGAVGKILAIERNPWCSDEVLCSIKVEGVGEFLIGIMGLEKITNPRPHAELIKQWADDASLEVEVFLERDGHWGSIENPAWVSNGQYRIKPKEPTQKQKLQSEMEELLSKVEEVKKQIDGLEE
jgi:hypothetical protein